MNIRKQPTRYFPANLIIAGGLVVIALAIIWIIFFPSDTTKSESDSTRVVESQPKSATVELTAPTQVDTGTPQPLTRPTQVIRTDARSTAYAVLYAFRHKEYELLANFVLERNVERATNFAQLDESDPARISFYSNWRWQHILAWDGRIGDIRYRHYVSNERDEYRANVVFGDLGSAELLVVTLIWENMMWAYEDLHTPPVQTFLTGSRIFKQIPTMY